MGSKSFALVIILIIILLQTLIQTTRVSATSSDNTWETKTPMPQNAYGDKAASVDGKIYTMGGFYSNNNEYDTLTNNWTAKTPPQNQSSFNMVAYQNRIYCIGGSATELYDPSSDTWETKATMPISINGLANVVNDNIYVISGYDSSQNQLMDTNEVYNTANNSWTTKNPILYPVSGYASTVCGSKIYIIGGQDPALGTSSMNVNFTQIYDTITDTWSFGAPMPTKVLAATAGATTGVMAPKRIYLFGGFSSATDFRSVDYHTTNLTQVYDPENDSWTYGAPMLSPRTSFAVVNVDDKLYVLGGSNVGLGAPYLLSNELYNPLGYGTLTQPLPSSSPTVPEFSSVMVLVFLSASVLVMAVLVMRRRKLQSI